MKVYSVQYNIGKCKYCVSFHDGIKKHQDNSPFYDIKLFKSKQKMNQFTASLRKHGFIEKSM
jgi:hypothetical protein